MMTTKTCPACASDNSLEAFYCSQCGSPFSPKADSSAELKSSSDVQAGGMGASLQPPQLISSEDTPVQDISPEIPLVQDENDLPCLVKVAGGFFGCLFGILLGCLVGLLCILPATAAMMGLTNSVEWGFPAFVMVIVCIVSMIVGILNGPKLLGKILSSFGETFRWMTSPKK
jgi:hypothetical protein